MAQRPSVLRWGILGSGGIARRFARELTESPRSRLLALGSRSSESAARFCSEIDASPRCGDYQSLLASDDIDAIYVALPNALHREWTIRALEAGKHVLCEKPLAPSLEDAAAMFAAAERNGRVLVEAFMYRRAPAIEILLSELRDGAIGELRLIRTHFTFNRPVRPGDVRFDPSLAGGALLDVGCYCVHFARAIAGAEPQRCRALAARHVSGVDELAGGVIEFPGGVIATFTSGMTVSAERRTIIGGSAGYAVIDEPWFGGDGFSIVTGTPASGLETRRVDCEPVPRIYAHEAERFARTVLDGEPPAISREDSLGNLRVLEALRREIEG